MIRKSAIVLAALLCFPAAAAAQAPSEGTEIVAPKPEPDTLKPTPPEPPAVGPAQRPLVDSTKGELEAPVVTQPKAPDTTLPAGQATGAPANASSTKPQMDAAAANQPELKPSESEAVRPPPASPAFSGDTPQPQPLTQDMEVAAYSGPLAYHQRHAFGWLGVRNDYVRDDRYDIFASNDALVALSIGAGGVVLASGDFSLAVLGLWEVGGRQAEVRGEPSELTLHRLEAGAEGRYHLGYRIYGFGRFTVGPARFNARRHSDLSGSEWSAKGWLLSSALTAGGALRLLGNPMGDERAPRLWFVAEGGYSLSSAARLRFQPETDDTSAPERAQPEELGNLSFTAPLFRLSVAGTY